jgi:hypothetical protein
MTNILNAGQVTVIGGTAGNFQAGIAREFVFNEVVSERRPVAIFLTDDPNDPTPLTQFKIWRKARGKPNSGEGRIHVTDALHRSRDIGGLIGKIDKVWGYTAPIIVRDISGNGYRPDRWIDGWASEIARVYRAMCLTVVSTGAHPLTSFPVTDVPGDVRWECSDDQLAVTLKNLASGDKINFRGRHVQGGLVFNQQREQEFAT